MNKFIIAIILFFTFINSQVYALDGSGTIEEVIVCGGNHLGQTPNPGWGQTALFKLSDGNWFGTWIKYFGSTATDYAPNPIYATILAAGTTGKTLDVRALSSSYTICGISATFVFRTAGEYVKVVF